MHTYIPYAADEQDDRKEKAPQAMILSLCTYELGNNTSTVMISSNNDDEAFYQQRSLRSTPGLPLHQPIPSSPPHRLVSSRLGPSVPLNLPQFVKLSEDLS